MTHTDFTPFASLAGGALIGLAAVLLMGAQGRIAGISGIASRLFPPFTDDQLAGRWAFIAGLVLAPLVWLLATGRLPLPTISASWPVLILAGLAVGFGTVLGSGCTSGHGVCGLARLSPRSAAATLVFMAAGFATVFLVRHIL